MPPSKQEQQDALIHSPEFKQQLEEAARGAIQDQRKMFYGDFVEVLKGRVRNLSSDPDEGNGFFCGYDTAINDVLNLLDKIL